MKKVLFLALLLILLTGCSSITPGSKEITAGNIMMILEKNLQCSYLCSIERDLPEETYKEYEKALNSLE